MGARAGDIKRWLGLLVSDGLVRGLSATRALRMGELVRRAEEAPSGGLGSDVPTLNFSIVLKRNSYLTFSTLSFKPTPSQHLKPWIH